MSCPWTFHFGDRTVEVDFNDYYDLFFEPYDYCDWLLEHHAWRNLDHACEGFHIDHVEMFGQWAAQEVAKLPEEYRNPVDGTVRDVPSLIRFLAGAFPWMVANHKLNQANAHLHELDAEAEAAVRAAAKELIDAALGYPPPYRDNMVSRSMVWADFVDRRWLQGLRIPLPWAPHRSAGDPLP
jgi:hypothetical protein